MYLRFSTARAVKISSNVLRDTLGARFSVMQDDVSVWEACFQVMRNVERNPICVDNSGEIITMCVLPFIIEAGHRKQNFTGQRTCLVLATHCVI